MCDCAGLWWGYNIGLAVQVVALLLFVARLNWQTEAHNVGAFISPKNNINFLV